nr:MAG TPA: hypothetical protein [Bacteriophage sp.]
MKMGYSKTIVQEFKNGVNVIHFPDLTEDERARRQEQLYNAAERFLKVVENANNKRKIE